MNVNACPFKTFQARISELKSIFGFSVTRAVIHEIFNLNSKTINFRLKIQCSESRCALYEIQSSKVVNNTWNLIIPIIQLLIIVFIVIWAIYCDAKHLCQMLFFYYLICVDSGLLFCLGSFGLHIIKVDFWDTA